MRMLEETVEDFWCSPKDRRSGNCLAKMSARRENFQTFPEKRIAQLQWIVLTIISTGQITKRELDLLAGIYLGLAVNFVSGNMFWVEGSAILVAKMSHLEAGHKTIISHVGIDLNSALAVHPSRG
ncbi:hypothetical protein BV898_14110 [Hypsibius exemplaris]|uniref:Uncharacterized protein n=1 Tax=Hypsibius exemplaris TaxID=2072580 RepID=A0A1W0W8X8_HYPEX|nr:hypothetical protein BV898_14110 [Hypsibius exemplaris]